MACCWESASSVSYLIQWRLGTPTTAVTAVERVRLLIDRTSSGVTEIKMTGRKYAESFQKFNPDDWTICIMCAERFIKHVAMSRLPWRHRYPKDVCMWCYSRGYDRSNGLYKTFMQMKKTIDAIGSKPCMKDETVLYNPECKCITCHCQRLHTSLFGEAKVEDPILSPVPTADDTVRADQPVQAVQE